MRRKLVGYMTVWISVFLLQLGASQAQDLSAFLPSDKLTGEFLKRSANTKALLKYSPKNIAWSLQVLSPSDSLEYSRSPDGIGNPTGSILTAAPEGGVDPTIAKPIGIKNLTIFVHERGSKYKLQDVSQKGYVVTAPNHSSFQDLVPFIGIGTEIRFYSDDWVDLGGKKYRNGGFRVTEAGFEFLPGTEFLGPDGTAVAVLK